MFASSGAGPRQTHELAEPSSHLDISPRGAWETRFITTASAVRTVTLKGWSGSGVPHAHTRPPLISPENLQNPPRVAVLTPLHLHGCWELSQFLPDAIALCFGLCFFNYESDSGSLDLFVGHFYCFFLFLSVLIGCYLVANCPNTRWPKSSFYVD